VEGPVPTVPESVAAAVPTLEPSGAAAPPPDSPAPPSASAEPGSSQPPIASAAPGPAPTPTDVAGIAAIVGEDPDLAGERGRELLAELERVAAKPDDRRRVERALQRTERWREAGQLEPAVADAALVALERALAELGAGDGAGRDDDDDDGDD
jgi:hypothetical protein